MTTVSLENSTKQYAAFFAALSPQTVGDLAQVAADTIHFSDPFHKVAGIEKVEKILYHMFSTTENPRFFIIDTAVSEKAGYIEWQFQCRLKKGGMALDFTGMSKITVDNSGKVAQHIDYWDAGQHLYSKIPILGWGVRKTARHIAKQVFV